MYYHSSGRSRNYLDEFYKERESFDELPNLIEKVKAAMAISIHSRAFSKELLRVEVTGPERPHLTIVDLPGLACQTTKSGCVEICVLEDWRAFRI